MCGIVGIVHSEPMPVDPEPLRRMLAMLTHRGPDEQGLWVEGPVGFGHARLSILDLAGGHQPMNHHQAGLWITFNGEIFNYLELRDELIARGHRFLTRSDTEVILHAYEQWGDACVERFNGQWAFAIWDSRRRRLFLSRDRLGIRPLFYTRLGSRLLFASEVKALFAHRDVPRRIDPIGMDQTFTYWSTLAPRTVFEGISELPPGHNLVWEDGRLSTHRYWQLAFEPDTSGKSESQWAEELIELLADATRLRMRSDVPVGAYLSGGLDSTLTTALIQRTTDAPLRTFSITFEHPEFDESEFQRAAVEALGTDHEAIRCTARDIGDVFPAVVWHAERPILRTAPAPLYLLSELVRASGFKVVVTGEGADEMFGGYDIFKEAKIRRFWATQPDSAWRPRLLEILYPYMPNLQAQSPAYRQAFFHARPEDLADPLFSHLPRWEMTSRIKSFFSDELRSATTNQHGYADCLATLPGEFAAWPPFCQAQFLESTTFLPGYLLSSQGDRAAMAHGVEGRYPFLDYRVAEFAGRIPPRMKMKGLCEKWLLKRAARGLVPEKIAARAKQPYRAPDAVSFFPASGPVPEYVRELLSTERIRRDGLFRPEAVEPLVRKAARGDLIGQRDNMALVGILSAQLMAEQFIHNRPSPPSERSTERPRQMAALEWTDAATEEPLETPSPVR
ncbi:MAG TPA: asparagine synthase (glutamine-hydrolyzing) [Thermoguttaceae bacterium]|nr:asparagine synthase (glutamine-hydrolyzing) [Thermoguttaceae bacterium]